MRCIRCGGKRTMGRVACGLCQGRGAVPTSTVVAYLESERGVQEVLTTDRFRYYGVQAPLPVKKPTTAPPTPTVFAPSWWRRLWNKLRGKR